MGEGKCVILCSAYPYTATGTAYAVRSILPVAVEIFDSVDYVAVSAEDRRAEETGDWAKCVNFKYVPANAAPKWKRFAKSLFSRWPATVQRYVVPGVMEALGETAPRGARKPLLVVIDAPLYWPMLADRTLKERFSGIVLWSQNVISGAFDGVIREVKGVQRLSWLWEIRRLRQYEQRALGDADRVWTITDHDNEQYREEFGFSADGILGVSLDTERFETPIAGSPSSIVYLGSFDIRKSLGIAKFVTEIFPRIKESFPEVSLWLGGKGSEAFDQSSDGVRGVGFVDDEADFLERGLIFVNPQESGSGIKLKSLHALAAGKVLLTTPVGVQGIPGEPGRDYFVADRVEEMEAALSQILSDGTDLESVARSGRILARKHYGTEEQQQTARKLFLEFLGTVSFQSARADV